MKTFTKLAFAPALAFAVLTPFAAANAGEKSDDIVVTSSAEMQAWQADATQSLNRALQRSPVERTATPGPGIVQVTFSLGADGRPENVELYNSTADWSAERSAMFAVRRLGDISDVPVSDPAGARFIANIIFADSVAEHDDLARELTASEAARLASGSPASDFIALGS